MVGWAVFNAEQADHGQAGITFAAYLATAHFVEATAENWESEFLQMAAYVALTAILFQRGSAESNNPDEAPEPHAAHKAPRRGVRRFLYSYSLGLAFALLFAIAFVSHAISGHRLNNDQLIAHGKPAVSLADFLAGAQFWFEAFQNWQSEFLAVLAICVLSIFLRHKGSPESKPVDMANDETP